jgi:hypothetical protein
MVGRGRSPHFRITDGPTLGFKTDHSQNQRGTTALSGGWKGPVPNVDARGQDGLGLPSHPVKAEQPYYDGK